MKRHAYTVDALNVNSPGKATMHAWMFKIAKSIQLTILAYMHCLRLGILARVLDALKSSQESPPFKSNLFSLVGNKRILSGSQVAPNIVSPTRGISRFSLEDYPKLEVHLLPF